MATIQLPHRGRPRKKQAFWEAKKATQGKLSAEREYIRKLPLKIIIKEKLLKALDNIDYIELAAIAAGTYIFHGVIFESELIKAKIAKFASDLGWELTHLLALGYRYVGGPSKQEIKVPDRIEYWIIAFFLSFCIVKYGGVLLSTLEKGFAGLATLLLTA